MHVAADDLMRPPLVRHLVRRHVVGVVDVLRVVRVDLGDEADRLRVGDRVRERLREPLITRELEDADLPVLVGEAYAWQNDYQNAGVASAYAVLVLAISLAVTLFYLRVLRVREETLA